MLDLNIQTTGYKMSANTTLNVYHFFYSFTSEASKTIGNGRFRLTTAINVLDPDNEDDVLGDVEDLITEDLEEEEEEQLGSYGAYEVVITGVLFLGTTEKSTPESSAPQTGEIKPPITP